MLTSLDRPAVQIAAGPLRKLPRKRAGRGIHRLDRAGRERVEAYTWLARQLAWQFARTQSRDIPADELIAEALFGLAYASSLFQEERGVPFGAYVRMVIRHRLIQSVIAWRRGKRFEPFPKIPTPSGPIEVEPEDRPAPDQCSQVASREMCEQVRCVLPARLYDILRLYHGEGRTLREIGLHFGISRQRVRQLVCKAGNRLRQHFPEWTRY
jgi:RNA polymerase sigma factor (sigma-70 family)